jgi:hypothetical protein
LQIPVVHHFLLFSYKAKEDVPVLVIVMVSAALLTSTSLASPLECRVCLIVSLLLSVRKEGSFLL